MEEQKPRNRSDPVIPRQEIILEFSNLSKNLRSHQLILETLINLLSKYYNFDCIFLSDLKNEPTITARSSEHAVEKIPLNSLINQVCFEKLESDFFCCIGANSTEEISNLGIQTLLVMKVPTYMYSDYLLGFIYYEEVFNPLKEDLLFFKTLTNLTALIIIKNEISKSIISANLTLQENAERMEREVEQRRELLRKVSMQTKELKRRNIEMEEFVYTISHDLKAPLISIQGFISALREDFEDNLPDEAKYYIERITSNTTQIEDMIKEVLEYSRIGRITQERKNLKLKEIIDTSLSPFVSQIESNNIKVNFKGKFPEIHAEENRMVQLFTNLFGNSIKYRGEGSDPYIEVGVLEKDSKFVTVYVKDNGIGIPEEFHEKIFNIFSRAVRSEKIEGSGIGLAHVKKIIQTHGGKIWIESKEKMGTTVFFTLPLAQ